MSSGYNTRSKKLQDNKIDEISAGTVSTVNINSQEVQDLQREMAEIRIIVLNLLVYHIKFFIKFRKMRCFHLSRYC